MNSSIPGTNKPGANSPAFTLKRARSDEGRNLDGSSTVPPLPPLPGNLILQVFTHKSLRRPGAFLTEYSDNERLSDLGKTALNLSLSLYFLRKRPMLKAHEISEQTRRFCQSGIIEGWVESYQLMKRLRCLPDIYPKLTLPEEICSVFYAYIGALFVSSGHGAVDKWIEGLLPQEMTEPAPNVKREPYQAISIPPPPKRPRSETLSPPPPPYPPIFFASQPPPPSPVYRPPKKDPFPNIATPPNPLSPAQPQAAFLPLFNEVAMKRRVTVEYLAEFSGPPHAGRWTVKCIVNGICKGEGSSSHKQTAKEDAARKAYYSMGWA